jgi:hydroxyacylglutathione hydrolase
VTRALDVPVHAHAAERDVWRHELGHLRRFGHFDAGTATGDLLARDPQSLTAREPLWDGGFRPVSEGQSWLLGGGVEVTARHTPGHTPGGMTYAVPGAVLTGDTLFPGGPGLTGWPLSDLETIMTSVRRLLRDPPGTVIHPGHGSPTTVGAERPHVDEWQARGW